MRKNGVVICIILLAFSQAILFNTYAENEEIQIVFKINILTHDHNPARVQWALSLNQNLFKIGIGVGYHERTNWENITKRTYNYPFQDDEIPAYGDGGFDVFFTGIFQSPEWDPTIWFSNVSVNSLTRGKNIYQYDNPEFNTNLESYLTTIDWNQKESYSYHLQDLLYDELPSICIVYPRIFFGYKKNITGIDYYLTSIGEYRAEKWDDGDDRNISLAIPFPINEKNVFTSEKNTFSWIRAVYGSLFSRCQGTHEIEPMIAINYTINAAGTEILVDIDPNAKFSDGETILAEDIVYTYEILLNPLSDLTETAFIQQWLEEKESIEAIDIDTVKFTLKQPYAFPKNLLTYGIIDKTEVKPIIDTYGCYSSLREEPFSTKLNGALVKSCGPFMISYYNESYIELVQNPYWKNLTIANTEEPHLDRLCLKYIENREDAINKFELNEVDIIDCRYEFILTDYEEKESIDFSIVDPPYHEELAVNMKHPIIGTGELTPVGTQEAAKNLRKAISHIINRQLIIDEILGGIGAPGAIPYPNYLVGFHEGLEPYRFDLSLAREYVESAGYDITVRKTKYSVVMILLSICGLAYVSRRKSRNPNSL